MRVTRHKSLTRALGKALKAAIDIALTTLHVELLDPLIGLLWKRSSHGEPPTAPATETNAATRLVRAGLVASAS